MPIKFRSSLACILLVSATSICQAEIIVYQVGATIVDVYDPNNVLQGSMNVGSTISGTYRFDNTVADLDPSVNFAYYDYTNLSSGGFDLIVNGESLKTDSTVPGFMHQVYIGDSFPDTFHIGSWGNRPLSNGAQVHDINLDLMDNAGAALNDAVLSSTPPNVAAFQMRELYIGGSNATGGASYTVIAQVDSLTAVSGSISTPGIVDMLVNATVSSVWDPANVLNNSVSIGANLSGSYVYNSATIDSDPGSEFGLYLHKPGSGSYGFDLNLSGHNFKTDDQQVEMNVSLFDTALSPDRYSVYSYGNNFPLPSGVQILDISMNIEDPLGNFLTSDDIATNPPTIINNGLNELIIFGVHPNGFNYFNIILTLDSLITASEPPSLLAISPASGIFDRMQRFDLGLILQANLAGVNSLRVLVNGAELPATQIACLGGAPNTQNRQTFVCPDISYMLNNGNNNVNVIIDLMDNTHISEFVKWEIIGF